MRPGGLVVAACLVAVPCSSPAQESRARPSRFRIGPIFFTPRLSLRAGVDTNVYNQATGETADASGNLSPSLTAVTPLGRRLRLSGNGALDFNYFRTQTSERSTDFSLGGRGDLALGPFTLFGGGGGGQSRQRFSIEADRRFLRQEKRVMAGATISFANRVSGTVQATSEVHNFEQASVQGSDVKGALDRNALVVAAQLRYSLTLDTKLLASLETSRVRFVGGSLGPPREHSRRYLMGFEFGERALLRGRIVAGQRVVQGSAPARAAGYRGPTFGADLSAPVFGYGRLHFSAERDISYAIAGSRVGSLLLPNAYVSGAYELGLAVELPRDLIARGNVGYERAKYLLPYTQGDLTARRTDRLLRGRLTLLRRVGNRLSVGGSLDWGRRDSKFPGQSYRGLRYGVALEFEP